MFLPMLLTEGVHQHTALPDRQMYIGDHHVHVTSRGSGNQWPQHLCLAPVQVITCSYHLLNMYRVSGTKLCVLYTFSCNVCDSVGHFIPTLHGKTETTRNN
uniref:G-patch domain containing 2 like n=2 Tax=Pongo abelii TaxID=9601 RepID=H2NLV3_PONAB